MRKRMAVIGVALAAGLAAGGAGCSDRCQGSLGEVGSGCPPSYDGTRESLTCPSTGVPIEVRSCGALRAVTFNGGYTLRSCFYDARSGALVGASQGSDQQEFCGQSSFGRHAGQTPPDACLSQQPDSVVECPDPTAPAGGP